MAAGRTHHALGGLRALRDATELRAKLEGLFAEAEVQVNLASLPEFQRLRQAILESFPSEIAPQVARRLALAAGESA